MILVVKSIVLLYGYNIKIGSFIDIVLRVILGLGVSYYFF